MSQEFAKSVVSQEESCQIIPENLLKVEIQETQEEFEMGTTDSEMNQNIWDTSHSKPLAMSSLLGCKTEVDTLNRSSLQTYTKHFKFAQEDCKKEDVLKEQFIKTEVKAMDMECAQDPVETSWKIQNLQDQEIKDETLDNFQEEIIMNHEKLGNFRCKLCLQVFPTKNSKEKHLRNDHEQTKSFSCEFCGKMFVKRYHMTAHVKTVHEKIRDFLCEFCDKTFVKKQSLKVHLQIHTGERPFQCQDCGLGFREKLEMTEHRIKHSETDDFKCVECSKQLNSRDSLYQHVYRNHRIAFSEFTCTICGKQFNQRAHLENHEKYHFDENGILLQNVDMFKCNMCEKFFKYENNLNTHMRSHTEGKQQCSICGKYYTTARGLREHITVKHEKISRFKCLLCGKAFVKESSLEIHKKTHLKPIHCEICNQSYKSNNSLVKHKQKEHAEYISEGF